MSAGGGYAVLSAVWIDGQATWGGDNADHGWGIAARVLYQACPSGLSTLIKDHLAGGASRLAALLLP